MHCICIRISWAQAHTKILMKESKIKICFSIPFGILKFNTFHISCGDFIFASVLAIYGYAGLCIFCSSRCCEFVFYVHHLYCLAFSSDWSSHRFSFLSFVFMDFCCCCCCFVAALTMLLLIQIQHLHTHTV